MVNCSGATIVSNARSLGREWELIQSLPIRDTQGIAYRFEDLKQRALSHKGESRRSKYRKLRHTSIEECHDGP
jgi:hypothetical protein